MLLAVSHYHHVVNQKCLWQIQVWAAVMCNWRFAEELGSSRLLGNEGLLFLGIVAPCRLPMCTQITLIRGT